MVVANFERMGRWRGFAGFVHFRFGLELLGLVDGQGRLQVHRQIPDSGFASLAPGTPSIAQPALHNGRFRLVAVLALDRWPGIGFQEPGILQDPALVVRAGRGFHVAPEGNGFELSVEVWIGLK